MILDNNTFEKVSSLFKTPHNKVSYVCKNSNGSTKFCFEFTDDKNINLSGFCADITENFEVLNTERLKQTWSKFRGQVVTEFLPIHPEGTKTTLYKLFYKQIKE